MMRIAWQTSGARRFLQRPASFRCCYFSFSLCSLLGRRRRMVGVRFRGADSSFAGGREEPRHDNFKDYIIFFHFTNRV